MPRLLGSRIAVGGGIAALCLLAAPTAAAFAAGTGYGGSGTGGTSPVDVGIGAIECVFSSSGGAASLGHGLKVDVTIPKGDVHRGVKTQLEVGKGLPSAPKLKLKKGQHDDSRLGLELLHNGQMAGGKFGAISVEVKATDIKRGAKVEVLKGKKWVTTTAVIGKGFAKFSFTSDTTGQFEVVG